MIQAWYVTITSRDQLSLCPVIIIQDEKENGATFGNKFVPGYMLLTDRLEAENVLRELTLDLGLTEVKTPAPLYVVK